MKFKINRRYLLLIGVVLICFLAGRFLGSGSQGGEEPVTQTTAAQTTTESPTEKDTAYETETFTDAETTSETKEETTTEEAETAETATSEEEPQASVTEDGTYTSKEEVAEYLHLFGHLPSNFITKNEAKKLGWVSSEGNLGKVAPGKSIGGDYFGNFEGLLPEKRGRDYYECDIDSTGGYRGAKRIIFSNDGLIYYTEDHYETFTLLYGEE